jgi:hypothetical protein
MKYTTVCIDIHGRIFDLSKEHPAWVYRCDGIWQKRFVKDAFTCSVEECEKLKARRARKLRKRKKRNAAQKT